MDIIKNNSNINSNPIMSYPMLLSRLTITGPINTTTPSVVLMEIADAHSIVYDENILYDDTVYLDELIHLINTKQIADVREPYDRNDYRLIARYVNKNCQWTKEPLNESFRLLVKYWNKDNRINPPVDFEYGEQTPQHPNRLNACVLYGICQANRINTSFNTTIDEMVSNIRLLLLIKNNQEENHNIKRLIYESLVYGKCEGYQLINMLSIMDPTTSLELLNNNQGENNNNVDSDEKEEINSHDSDKINKRISYEDLLEAGANIRDRSIRLHPHTHVEAVAMAAVHYKIDISLVKNPLAEYQEMMRTPYFPLDEGLSQRLHFANKYPDSIQNPRLDQVFNPELPSILYDNSDLVAMCIEEGYDNETIQHDSPYTLLQTSYFIPTFFHGKQGRITNEETTMMESIYDTEEEKGLEYDDVIVYGIRGDDMVAYSYGELYDIFHNYRCFQKPDGEKGQVFTEETVRKLMTLCVKDQRSGESDESLDNRLLLGDELDRIWLYIKTNQKQVYDFVDIYESVNQPQKEKINDFLEQLLYCAMYMRGWKGEGPYPLTSEDALTSEEETCNIELRVTNSIISLEQMLEDLDKLLGIGELIKELPLMIYQRRNGEIIPSTDEEEGLTIYERINIVKGGVDGSVQSCIRMSSNRFAASAYYYMQLLNLPEPFDITIMSNIV